MLHDAAFPLVFGIFGAPCPHFFEDRQSPGRVCGYSRGEACGTGRARRPPGRGPRSRRDRGRYLAALCSSVVLGLSETLLRLESNFEASANGLGTAPCDRSVSIEKQWPRDEEACAPSVIGAWAASEMAGSNLRFHMAFRTKCAISGRARLCGEASCRRVGRSEFRSSR